MKAFSQIIGDYLGPYSNAANLNLFTLIVLFILLALFLIGITFGRSRLLLGLLSLYVARLLELNFVYFGNLEDYFKNTDSYILHLAVFIIFIMLTFVLLQRSILAERLSLLRVPIFFVALMSMATLGFLATLILPHIPKEFYSSLKPELLRYFTTAAAQFWWAVTPILALVFIRRRYN